MKKTGSRSDFSEHRDRELYGWFRRHVADRSCGSLSEAYERAAKSACSRFWVSEVRAAEVVSAMRRGVERKDMVPERRRMYEEIKRRVDRILESDPSLCATVAVGMAVCSPAPEFYLTVNSARVIIGRYLKKVRARKKAAAVLSTYREGGEG